MATVILTRGKTLPDTGTKTDLHELIDNSTATVSSIVNADIHASAAIAKTKVSPIFGSQDLTCKDMDASGSATVAGTLDVTGAVTTAALGGTDITASGELDGATLDISGNADIDGTLDVGGTLTLVGDLEQTGDQTVTGDVAITGDVAVTGETEILGDFESTDAHQVGGSTTALAVNTEYQANCDGFVTYAFKSTSNAEAAMYVYTTTGVPGYPCMRTRGLLLGSYGAAGVFGVVKKGDFWKVNAITVAGKNSEVIRFTPLVRS